MQGERAAAGQFQPRHEGRCHRCAAVQRPFGAGFCSDPGQPAQQPGDPRRGVAHALERPLDEPELSINRAWFNQPSNVFPPHFGAKALTGQTFAAPLRWCIRFMLC